MTAAATIEARRDEAILRQAGSGRRLVRSRLLLAQNRYHIVCCCSRLFCWDGYELACCCCRLLLVFVGFAAARARCFRLWLARSDATLGGQWSATGTATGGRRLARTRCRLAPNRNDSACCCLRLFCLDGYEPACCCCRLLLVLVGAAAPEHSGRCCLLPAQRRARARSRCACGILRQAQLRSRRSGHLCARNGTARVYRRRGVCRRKEDGALGRGRGCAHRQFLSGRGSGLPPRAADTLADPVVRASSAGAPFRPEWPPTRCDADRTTSEELALAGSFALGALAAGPHGPLRDAALGAQAKAEEPAQDHIHGDAEALNDGQRVVGDLAQAVSKVR